MKKQTDRVRKLYKYFKAGRGEMAFAISLFQLFLLFELTEVDAYVRILIAGVVISLCGVSIGWFSVKYLDTTSPYVMPYTQDYIRKDVLQLRGLMNLNNALYVNGFINEVQYKKINDDFDRGLKLRSRWLDKPIND